MSRNSQLYSKWALEMRRSDLFRAGERVGVAVSGGADSVLLFDFMKRLARQRGLVLIAVHFNHRLRGAESDGDEAFVRELAQQNEVEFLGSGADVARAAREAHSNLEAMARRLRYQFFFGLVRQGKLDKLATAHTADDQAETVLMRLLRGTGTRGLGGIYPALEGVIIRPFLTLTRDEVRAEVKGRNLPFRIDSSNLDTRLVRNKMRNELLPQLARDFNPQVVRLLAELAERARDDESYLEQQARERARPWRGSVEGQEKIPLKPLLDFPPALQRRILRQIVMAVRGSLRGIAYAHIEALRRFVSAAQSGRQLVLPGVLARKDFDWLVVAPQSRRLTEGARAYSYPVELPGVVPVPELGVTFRFKIVDTEKLRTSYNKLGLACLDRMKLGTPLVLRSWCAGDRFQPGGTHKLLKLKELLSRGKIPSSQRRLWPVLQGGEGIVWVKGFPPAGFAAAAPGSVEVVVLSEDCLAANLPVSG
ncbi:MAG TPA: tRNA lysidine(34) synthetase TilS [Terriglobia bacterium]|nr:tRNA lysidine(34) synthetase TilS [Terriglobia bacterium]